MDEATVCEVQQWLHKADHDLRSAARLMETGDDEPLLIQRFIIVNRQWKKH